MDSAPVCWIWCWLVEVKTRKHEDDCDMFSVSLWMTGQLTKAIREEKQVQRENGNAPYTGTVQRTG